MPLGVVVGGKLRRGRILRIWVGLMVGLCLVSQLHDHRGRYRYRYDPRLRGQLGGIGGGIGGGVPGSSSSSSSSRNLVSDDVWWATRHLSYPSHGHVRIGILSRKPFGYFQELRDAIDVDDHSARCERYGFRYAKNRTEPRRIFYGAMIANEPWELFEVAGAEAHGVFSGAVFVEGNRTQNFTPRNPSRLTDGPLLARLLGLPPTQVQVRLYANEDERAFAGDWDSDLSREHAQRHEILAGWKALGMTGDDLGYLGDSDEVFSRDYYRALQYCDGIAHLDPDTHKCHYKFLGLKSSTLVFEGSPDCPTKARSWYRPDIFPGACLEVIGDEKLHPKAPRPRPGSMDRATGYNDPGTGSRAGEDNITDGRYPLLNGADMRRIGGTIMVGRRQQGHTHYSGYHLHNFFAGADAIRFKYRTYGHARETDYRYRLADLDADLSLMVRCVHNNLTNPNRHGYYEVVKGGMMGMKPPYPLYFMDDEYRKERHEFVTSMVVADELEFDAFHNASKASA